MSKNILINPGFESGCIFVECIGQMRLSGEAGDWSYSITKGTYIRKEADKEYLLGPTGLLDVKEGKDALYIGTLRGGKVTVYQEIGVEPGTAYYASTWLKAL